MTHKIVELAPVGSQWKVKRGGTFFSGRVLTVVRHDLNERRIRYVYGNDVQEMSKAFETFEREHELGNIRIVDAAPKATVSLYTGDVIKTADCNCSPFSGGSELTILDICGLTDEVKYKYKNGSTCTKDLSQFHDFLRRGLMTVIGRAPSQKVMAESGYKVGDLFDVCMRHDRQYTEGRILRIEKIEDGVVSYNYVCLPMSSPSGVPLELFIKDVDTGVLTLRGPAQKPRPKLKPEEVVPVQIKSPFFVHSDELFKTATQTHRHSGATHLSVAERFEEIRRKFRGLPVTQVTRDLAEKTMRDVMPAGVEWELEFNGNDMTLHLGPTAHKKMIGLDYAAVEARAMAASLQPATGSALDQLLKISATDRNPWLGPKLDGKEASVIVTDEIKPEVKSEEKPMTRIVNVFLMDTTPGLKAAERLIGKVENFATDARNDTTMLLEMSMEHNLADMLREHNKRRKAIINQDILNRVGKTVYLQPIEMSDVKIDIKLVTGL